MTFDRRGFLASSAALGIAVAMGDALASSDGRLVADATTRVRLVQSAMSGCPDFLRGLAGAASSIAPLLLPTWFDHSRWRALVAEVRNSILVGLVTEAELVFVHELVREVSGRVAYSGSHLDLGVRTHHVLTTTPSSAGIGAALAEAIGRRGHETIVEETALVGATHARNAGPRGRTASAGRWPSHLGALLAEVAGGRWIPSPIERHIRIGEADASGAAEHAATHLVSFVVFA